MSTQMEPLFEGLRDKLDHLGDRVTDLWATIGRDPAGTKVSIDKEVEAAMAALRRVKDDADAARARMKAQLGTKRDEDLLAEWKRSRNMDELQRRAEDAEAYAAWSVMVAAAAIDEAKLATLRVIAARQDVEMMDH